MLAKHPQLHSNSFPVKPVLVCLWAQMGAVRFTGMTRGISMINSLEKISGRKKVFFLDRTRIYSFQKEKEARRMEKRRDLGCSWWNTTIIRAARLEAGWKWRQGEKFYALIDKEETLLYYLQFEWEWLKLLTAELFPITLLVVATLTFNFKLTLQFFVVTSQITFPSTVRSIIDNNRWQKP